MAQKENGQPDKNVRRTTSGIMSYTKRKTKFLLPILAQCSLQFSGGIEMEHWVKMD